jgi:hypothetical protein
MDEIRLTDLEHPKRWMGDRFGHFDDAAKTESGRDPFALLSNALSLSLSKLPFARRLLRACGENGDRLCPLALALTKIDPLVLI